MADQDPTQTSIQTSDQDALTRLRALNDTADKAEIAMTNLGLQLEVVHHQMLSPTTQADLREALGVPGAKRHVEEAVTHVTTILAKMGAVSKSMRKAKREAQILEGSIQAHYRELLQSPSEEERAPVPAPTGRRRPSSQRN